MHRAAIKRLLREFLENRMSEDEFWYRLSREAITGGHPIMWMIAKAMDQGLQPEGGDGE